jgi:cytochrome d ubiquinol oxidase subunit II
MTTFWYGTLGVLFAAYFVLGGLDIGVGLLLPTQTRANRRATLNALGPFFLGNEVWVVGAGGILLAAFPRVESTLFASVYPLIFALVAGLVAINVGVQLRSRPERESARAAFDVLIAAGSVVLAVGWGVLLGDLLTGLPLGHGAVVANGWFPVAAGVAMAVLAAAHGTAYLAWRLPDQARQVVGARRLLLPLAAIAVAGAAVLGYGDPRVRAAVGHPAAAVVLAGAVVVLLAVATVLSLARRPRLAVLATSLSLALPVVLVGLALFPNVVVATGGGAGVTVASGAADGSTLNVLTWACAPAIPILFALQAISWSLFRTKRAGTRYW